MDLSHVLSRALLCLYPADVRRRTGKDLEAAFAYCVARERERHGPPGVAYAWAHLVVDAIATSVRCVAMPDAPGTLPGRTPSSPHERKES
jgi:hypothetical protein